jgi:hypothetical protein
MDFGERKFQGSRGDGLKIRDIDWSKEPSELNRVTDPMGARGNIKGAFNSESTLADFKAQNPSLSHNVGVRNAAGQAEQDATRSMNTIKSSVSNVSQDAAKSAKSGLSDLAQDGRSATEGIMSDLKDGASKLGGMGQDLLSKGKSALSSGLKTIGLGAGDEEAGGAAETIGGILDATPLAPLGWLFGAVGGALDVAGAYQAAKGIGNWVDDDILGHHPSVNFKKTKLPTASSLPTTMSITPTLNSSMDIPTTGGSW